MENKNLEWIIGSCVGIGKTKREASSALFDIKESKKEEFDDPEKVIDLYRNHREEYIDKSVGKYDGERLEDEPNVEIESKAERTRERYSQIESPQAREIFLEQIKEDCIDPRTGVLTPFGDCILESEEYKENTFYLMFDADDMHYWNDSKGFEKVDERLDTIGKSLKNNIREYRNNDHVVKYNEGKRRVQRMNGSTGDEFLVEINCREEDIEGVARRLLGNVHEDQIKKFYNGEKLEENRDEDYLVEQLEINMK